jgi:hypothetical protein
MAPMRTLLLIADMSGYTAYMRTHRFSLAHAEVNTTRLLKKVIDAAPGFDLIELEGDAAFLSRNAETLDPHLAVTEVLHAAAAMQRAFHYERAYVAANLCPCSGCKEVDNLKLKFVAHVAEVATQTIRDRTNLVGFDVILVHRLLKNPVEIPEYVLMSEELYRAGDLFGPRRDRPRPRVLRRRREPRGAASPGVARADLARTVGEDVRGRWPRHAVPARPAAPTRADVR